MTSENSLKSKIIYNKTWPILLKSIKEAFYNILMDFMLNELQSTKPITVSAERSFSIDI